MQIKLVNDAKIGHNVHMTYKLKHGIISEGKKTI